MNLNPIQSQHKRVAPKSNHGVPFDGFSALLRAIETSKGTIVDIHELNQDNLNYCLFQSRTILTRLAGSQMKSGKFNAKALSFVRNAKEDWHDIQMRFSRKQETNDCRTITGVKQFRTKPQNVADS